MRQILIPAVSSMQISRCIRRVSVHLPTLRGSCDNSCYQKLRPRKTNGSVVMPPAGTTKYDNLFHAAEGELDRVKRAALFIAMNDMVVENGVVIPVVCRPQVSALSKKLRATLSGWDSTFWNLKDWYREA